MARVLVVLVMLGLLAPALATEALCQGSVLFHAALRSADDDAEPAEDQKALGVTVTLWQERSRPLGFVIGAQTSRDDADFVDPFFGLPFNWDVHFLELYIGGAKLWDAWKSTRPYAGGGFTFLRVDAKLKELSTGASVDDADRVFAPYVNGGVYWSLGKRFNLGLDARVVFHTRASLFGADFSGNYLQLGGIAGWGW